MNYCIGCGAGIDDTEDLCDSCLDEMEANRECEFCCRPINDHSVMCIENESPFAQLMQKGYD